MQITSFFESTSGQNKNCIIGGKIEKLGIFECVGHILG